ncbi:MAG: hypothetical protein EAZ85_00625 [Bacteroidetes bacterium]|nr:MAG: hypothetical protein EAZ85_00625 [Bacteroidota bacterium]TAG86146.1 MAG: hypothetical protein EAZ20_13350 [Bacteroidota bacterium]
MYKYFTTIILFFSIFSLLKAQYNPANNLNFLEDKTEKITFEEIKSGKYDKKFQKNTQNILNFGNSTHIYWLKFSYQNPTNEKYYLEISNGMLDKVTFYTLNDKNEIQQQEMGGTLPRSKKNIKTNALLFELLENRKENIYWIKIKSNFPIEIPMQIDVLPKLLEKHHTNDIFLGMYFGIMLVMGLYNLFLFLSIKDKVYFYYVLYVWSIGFFYLHLKGFINDVFWGEMPFLNFYTPFYSCIPPLGMVLFANSFLNTKKYTPILHQISKLFFLIFIGCMIANLLGDFVISASISQLSSLILVLYMLFMGIMVHTKGNPLAKFFIISWSVYIASVVIFIMQVAGVISSTTFTSNSVLYGTMIELVLLSFALAYRINLLKTENLNIIRQQNEILEIKVEARTSELSLLNREINAQNEELTQSQEELKAQRDFIEMQKNDMESYNTKIKSSINASKIIQNSILPSDKTLQQILKNYFILYLPKDEVSGDFYWVQEIEDGFILACIDCTGHGVPGAFMTTIANSLLDEIIILEKNIIPAQILERLNQRINIVLKQDETNNQNGMDISIITFQKENMNNILHFAGAKLNLYYYQNQELKEIKGTRKSIGSVYDTNQTFENHTIILENTSTLYLSTDGFSDQNNEQRKKIGDKNFFNILNEIQSFSLDIQKEKLNEILLNQMENTSQRDDVLVIGIRI